MTDELHIEQPNLWGEIVEQVDGISLDAVQDVFDFWVEKCDKDPKRTKLLDSRKKKISTAIKNYGVETCKQAIQGCANTPWNMGANPRNRPYNDISLILRNEEKIERFVGIYEDTMGAELDMALWMEEAERDR